MQRFLNYIKWNTMSDDTSSTCPSTQEQLAFAQMLKEDCKAIGLSDISIDQNGYVMATLPSNRKESVPTVGFIAHMDTIPEFSGRNVKPQIIKNYDGKAILLNAKEQMFLSPLQFPILKQMIGETLITTDGTTVLGADDKAGIAEILEAMDYLVKHPNVPHGTIRIAFTPDEEICRGANHFNVKQFGCDFAYTLDGCGLGELQCENFNAASAIITIYGLSIHPSIAKGKMKNSASIACEYQALLPKMEVPEHTEGYEGYFHLCEIKGDIEKTTMHYTIRDHDKQNFEKRKQLMIKLAHQLNQKYGKGTIHIAIRDSYFNMKEVIDRHPYVMDLALNAFKNLGITPVLNPIRGGTDGARLSFMGLPCPNLFIGSYNGHGPYEFAVVSEMEQAVQVIIEICRLVGK